MHTITETKQGAKFSPGRIVATPGVLRAVGRRYEGRELSTMLDLGRKLSRHLAGDWGNLDDEDREANELALNSGERLLSCYCLDDANPSAGKMWVITEADRSVTTFLLPEEY